MRTLVRCLCLLVLPLLWSGCKDEKREAYPSVKLEFITLLTDEQGLTLLVPDRGEALHLTENRTSHSFKPGDAVRAVGHYEVLTRQGSAPTARLYTLVPLSPLPPLAEAQPNAKSHPLELVSMWMGRGFLNLVLNLRVVGNEPHTFSVVEEERTETDEAVHLTLRLYHEAGQEGGYRNRRAYLSIFVQPYLKPAAPKPLRVTLRYPGRDAQGSYLLKEQSATSR